MRHPIPACLCLLALLPAMAQAAQTFMWSMEAETADVFPAGTDSTPNNYPPAPTLRSDKQALSGKHCLDLTGSAWRQATFDNPTDNHIWAPTQQGAIVLHWKFTGTLGTVILMQMTGKLKGNKQLDTDDGLSVRIREGRELSFGYAWNNATEKTSVKYVPKTPFAADRWYKVTAKWNATSKPHLSLQIDNEAPVLGETPLGETKCKAWHHLLWGNDTRTAPEGLFLDDVAVWDDFAMQPGPTKSTPSPR